MADEIIEFIDCSSISISFDIMGLATVSYTLVRNVPGMATLPEEYSGDYFQAGTRTFYGYVTNITMNQIPNTTWYENHVTWMTTTDAPLEVEI